MQVNVISNFALFTYYSLSLSNSKSLYYYYYYYYYYFRPSADIRVELRYVLYRKCVKCIENV